MYWPIGAPRLYAANKDQSSQGNSITSADGLRSLEDEGKNEAHEEKRSQDGQGQPLHTNGDTVKQGQPPFDSKTPIVEGDVPRRTVPQEQVSDEEIVEFRSTRSGQTFATITNSTLTIWQTKVYCRPLKSRTQRF